MLSSKLSKRRLCINDSICFYSRKFDGANNAYCIFQEESKREIHKPESVLSGIRVNSAWEIRCTLVGCSIYGCITICIGFIPSCFVCVYSVFAHYHRSEEIEKV